MKARRKLTVCFLHFTAKWRCNCSALLGYGRKIYL